MVQGLGLFAVLPEDPTSVSSSRIRQLTTTCNARSRRSSNVLLGFWEHLHAQRDTHRDIHKLKYILKKQDKKVNILIHGCPEFRQIQG